MHRIHHDIHGLVCWDEWQHMQTVIRNAGRDWHADAFEPPQSDCSGMDCGGGFSHTHTDRGE